MPQQVSNLIYYKTVMIKKQHTDCINSMESLSDWIDCSLSVSTVSYLPLYPYILRHLTEEMSKI